MGAATALILCRRQGGRIKDGRKEEVGGRRWDDKKK